MGRPLRIEYPGAFYHVTSRGNERRDIVRSGRDREKFVEYLESATVRHGAGVHAYCLMTNHYHLLLETPQGNVSEIMKHINGAYTNYFNAKRGRSGHLLQGRFKAILVERDEYALELSRHTHLNPVRAKREARGTGKLYLTAHRPVAASPAGRSPPAPPGGAAMARIPPAAPYRSAQNAPW